MRIFFGISITVSIGSLTHQELLTKCSFVWYIAFLDRVLILKIIIIFPSPFFSLPKTGMGLPSQGLSFLCVLLVSDKKFSFP